MFNLEVAGVHNYFADGLLVHNKTIDRDRCEDQKECDAEEQQEADRDDIELDSTGGSHHQEDEPGGANSGGAGGVRN